MDMVMNPWPYLQAKLLNNGMHINSPPVLTTAPMMIFSRTGVMNRDLVFILTGLIRIRSGSISNGLKQVTTLNITPMKYSGCMKMYQQKPWQMVNLHMSVSELRTGQPVGGKGTRPG